DARDYRQWDENFPAALDTAAPENWIAVIPDVSLVEWRNLIARQICLECHSQTVAVLGRRIDIGEAGLRDILESDHRMQDELWQYVPRSAISEVEIQMYDAMKLWVEKYMMEKER
ncbi:MAG: hypothetical protein K8I82_31680, partial [Anaerolineae bacterium]|nr:hypothetical protein [Anaerolineae bacterium]